MPTSLMRVFFERLVQAALSASTRLKNVFAQRPKTWCVFVIGLVFLLVLAFTPNPTSACVISTSGGDIASCFYSLAITILGGFVSALGAILTFFIEIFVNFAKYNQFANAIPVTIGWTLVRDICNMFFIVILLLAAFGTILPFDTGFNYKLIPKLLITVVLINFSKTLTMILIDISQVIMLTFVQAFAQSAGGNFAQLFGLTSLLQVNPSPLNAVPDQTTPASFINIFITYILAIVLLVIACGVMGLLTMYLMARIIGLWMVIIFSPAGFMLGAIPGKLTASLGSLGEFWKKLGPLLSGGPIVAFFVWLALATVQQAGQQSDSNCGANAPTVSGSGAAQCVGLASSLGLYTQDGSNSRLGQTLSGNGSGAAQSGTVTGFLSQIGNTQGIATFIVGISMLLMGLDAAASSTKAINSTIGAWAEQGKKWTLGSAKAAAKLAGGAALVGGSGVVPGVLALRGAQAAGRIGKGVAGGAATLARGAGLEGAYASISKDITGKAGNLKAIETWRDDDAKKAAQEAKKHSQHLTGWQKTVNDAWTERSIPLAWQKEQRMKNLAIAQGNQEAFDVKGKKKELAAAKATELQKTGLSKKDAERGAGVFASHQVAEQQRKELAALEQQAKGLPGQKENKEFAAKIKEQREKNLTLMPDQKSVNEWVEKNAGPEGADARKALDADSASDVRVHMAMLDQVGALERDGQGRISGINTEAAGRVVKENKDTRLGQGVEGTVNYLTNSNLASKPKTMQDMASMHTVPRVGRQTAMYDGQTGQQVIPDKQQGVIQRLQSSGFKGAEGIQAMNDALSVGMDHTSLENIAQSPQEKQAVNDYMSGKARTSLVDTAKAMADSQADEKAIEEREKALAQDAAEIDAELKALEAQAAAIQQQAGAGGSGYGTVDPQVVQHREDLVKRQAMLDKQKALLTKTKTEIQKKQAELEGNMTQTMEGFTSVLSGFDNLSVGAQSDVMRQISYQIVEDKQNGHNQTAQMISKINGMSDKKTQAAVARAIEYMEEHSRPETGSAIGKYDQSIAEIRKVFPIDQKMPAAMRKALYG